MTNKIMQNNSLYNINQNKVLQDKLSTQMSTQKKLTRPSDDPVVAIRALRLRSSVSEITQYEGKNAPDANSWLKVTSDGLGTVTEILTSMNTNANKAANKDLTYDELEIITTQLRSLTEEFYATGNLDYAGRFVFTGYRTNTPMSFTQADVSDTLNPIPSYSITQQLKASDVDTINYTVQGHIKGANKNNYNDGTHNGLETEVSNRDLHRLRLAYDDITYPQTTKLNIMKADGKTVDTSYVLNAVSLKSTNMDDAYLTPAAEATLIVETGEIILSDDLYDEIKAKDTEVRIEYEKSEWKNGDLRPEHYFACYQKIVPADIGFNRDYLNDFYENKERQTIAYDVGYNQTIEVNTTADEVFTHDLKRDITDLEKVLNDLNEINATKTDLEDILKYTEESDPNYRDIQLKVNAANKVYDYIRDNIHGIMEKMITKTQNYLDATNVAITDNGTRSSRLDLITKRLTEQKTTFRTLQSENEDVDIAEVAIELTSAELTYSSSLMGTGKIMQTTLMNYI
ncbi:MAG: hypothetical protein K6A38_08805 [Lachnospiraceae bacterium]|nr:hypothetical protein [Lachnospiraceae bacterium]